MNLTTETFDRLELSAPSNGFASPLTAGLILGSAFLVKAAIDFRAPMQASWADWSVLLGLAAAMILNLREAWSRARRRDWVLILDRKAGRVTFIRVRPVRVRPKVIALSDILDLDLGGREHVDAGYRYQPRFRLTSGRLWHVPDLWGDRPQIARSVEAINTWLRAAPPPAAQPSTAEDPATHEDSPATSDLQLDSAG